MKSGTLQIEDPLSEKLLFGEIRPGHTITIDVENFDPADTTPAARDTAHFVFRARPTPARNMPDTVPAAVSEE